VARKSNSTIVQEELYPLPDQAREPFDDSRLVDLEADQESPFLRGQKRVNVRRGSLPKKTANRLKWVALAAFVLAIVGVAGATLYGYGKHSWRFRVDSSDLIEISGAQHVTHAQIMEVMGGDIGRNIFFIPLAQRKLQLEQIPWVESASVMRFVPNRLSVEIHERTPVAFARIGSRIYLMDPGGTLMELAPGGKKKYSFPVIAGMNAGEPLSTRAARMKIYNELVRQLDFGGAHYSQELSEVDLDDPENVKVVVADPNGDVLVHLGSTNYLQRYKTYVTHAQQWRQQFDKLESVDLRYDGQIIVNPDLEGMSRKPVLTPAAAKAAMAAGVKPAAIVNYEKYVTHGPPAAQVKKAGKPVAKAPVKAPASAAAKTPAKASAKAVARRTPSKSAKSKKPTVTLARSITPVPHAGAHATIPNKPTTPSAPPANKVTKLAPAATATTSAAGQKKPSAAIPRETAKDQR
jgi:cell division protein FtsQ